MKVQSAKRFFMPERLSHSAARGALLAHLIGASFFCAFIFSRAFPQEILFTKLMDWPIRLVGIWLLMDRFGRYRQARLSAWDWVHLLFVAGYGISLVYAELYMTRDTGFINYLQWMNQVLNGYFYFLVVREGITRRGFRPDIVIQWALATFFVACCIAVTQARDIGGMRVHIDNFYHQKEAEWQIEGPSAPWQARAPTVHANSLAIMLVCGLPLLLALSALKRLSWFDWLTGSLMVATIFMTYSRVGIVSLAAIGIGVVIVLLVRKEYHKAAVGLFSCLAAAVVFVWIVYTFDVTRFKVLVSPAGPVAGSTSETIGWRLREESIKRAIGLAMHYPVTGLQAASGALNQENVLVKNPYTFSGLVLNVYFYSFIAYGLIGVGFLLALYWLILSQIRLARSSLAFAAPSFVIGVGLVVAGITENVLFYDQAMITMNIVMAMCVMGVARASIAERVDPLLRQMRLAPAEPATTSA